MSRNQQRLRFLLRIIRIVVLNKECIDSPPLDEAMARRGRSCAMQSRFFLPGIAPDVARIVQAFAARFLEPFIQFILVLIESVATKDIAPRKRGWSRFPAML